VGRSGEPSRNQSISRWYGACSIQRSMAHDSRFTSGQEGTKLNTRTVLAILLIAFSLVPLSNAAAIPLEATGGSIDLRGSSPVPFDDVSVRLDGGGFSLTNSFLQDSFRFADPHNPALFLLSPGDPANFSGRAFLTAPSDLLIYNGISYRATGSIGVAAAPVPAAAAILEPFVLSGMIHGVSLIGSDSIDVDLRATGILSASFVAPGPGQLELSAVRYDVASVPEPGSAFLVGTGLLALRWRTRRHARKTLRQF
jgi:PEP-CTERM motif